MIAWLWAKISGYAVAAGAAIALLAGVWLKAKSEGRAAEREIQARHKAEAIANKRKLDSEIDDLAPADLDQRFRPWVREDER